MPVDQITPNSQPYPNLTQTDEVFENSASHLFENFLPQFEGEFNASVSQLNTDYININSWHNFIQSTAYPASLEAVSAQQDIQNNYATYRDDATYSFEAIDRRVKAIFPNNGRTKVSKRADNFTFYSTVGNEYKVTDNADEVCILGKVHDRIGKQDLDFSNTIPDVTEVITDGSNTTSVAVSKGDFVVDGSELINNGTFDTNTSGWSTSGNGTLSLSNGGCKLLQTTTDNEYMTQTTSLEANKEYLLTFEIIDDGISARSSLSATTSIGGTLLNATGFGVHTVRFTAVGGSTGLRFFTGSSSDNIYFIIDNISLVKVSNTFRATKDTAEMYDYLSDKGVVTVNNGDVIKVIEGHLGGGTVGVANHYYKALGTYTDNTNSFQYGLAQYWQDLGTATNMSLDNPFFQDRSKEGVWNQAIALDRVDLAGNHNTSTEVVFDDIRKADLLSIDTVMAKVGYSKVEDYLYSKDGYMVSPIGLWTSKNKGAYQPFLNGQGSTTLWKNDGSFSASHKWYSSDAKVTSTSANCFEAGETLTSGNNPPFIRSVIINGTISGGLGGNGRPDEKYYDVIYEDDFIDLRCFAKELTKWEFDLLKKDREKWGISEKVITEQVLQTTTGTVTTLEVSDGTLYAEGAVLQIWNGTTGYRKKIVSITSNTVTLDSTISKTAVDFIISGGTIPILSSKESLSIDMIGNPTNYPQVMKDRLASGLGVNGVYPLLVGQDGTDYTSGTVSNAILKHKAVDIESSLYQVVSTGAWNVWSATLDSTENSLEQNLTADTLNGLISYTSKNNPYIQCDPKAIFEVNPKVIASNSHSIYKGADKTNQITGKIATGNGSNGLESKVLENAELSDSDWRSDMTSQEIAIGDIIYVVEGFSNSGISGHYYRNLTFNGVYNLSLFYYSSASFKDLGDKWSKVITTPKHSAIQLDNSSSPTAKWFTVTAIEDDATLDMIYSKEIIYDDATWNQDGTPTNTYGDNNEFDQLANGTDTDENGNTINTFVGASVVYGKVTQ